MHVSSHKVRDVCARAEEKLSARRGDRASAYERDGVRMMMLLSIRNNMVVVVVLWHVELQRAQAMMRAVF